MKHLNRIPRLRAVKRPDDALRDVVGLQSIVIGADLVLTITDDQRMTLHTVTPEGTSDLGTFDSVSAAWAAVDAFDMGIDRSIGSDKIAA
jgi:hypothetical protein